MRGLSIAALAAVAVFTGCGGEDDEAAQTPAACLGSPAVYLEALDAAPQPVRLDGDTPISSCLVDEQEPGAQGTVGKAVIDAATQLNREVRSDPDPQTTLELGYLVGAVERGAASSGGIHEDLRLRINTAARFTPEGEPPFGAEFERAFGEGYAAAQADG